jgi:hypothetical protein
MLVRFRDRARTKSLYARVFCCVVYLIKARLVPAHSVLCTLAMRQVQYLLHVIFSISDRNPLTDIFQQLFGAELAGQLLSATGMLCNAYMKLDAITMGVSDILLKPDALAKYALSFTCTFCLSFLPFYYP